MDRSTNVLSTKSLNGAGYRSVKRLQIIIDVSIVCLALVLAYLLRFDFVLTDKNLSSLLIQLCFVVPIQVLSLRLYGVHKFIWRYTSLGEAKRIITAFLVATVPMVVLRLIFWSSADIIAIPMSIIFLDFCMASIGVLGIRLVRRELYENDQRSKRSKTKAAATSKRPVILVGAGQAGVTTLAEIKRRGTSISRSWGSLMTIGSNTERRSTVFEF